MTRYGRHCPVASATEVLGETWTLLVVRELLHGSSNASEIAMGLPGMPPSLLARRFKTLTDAGVVQRAGSARFELTPAGRRARPVQRDPAARWWWLVLSPDGATSTATDPRLPTPARIDCTLSALAGVWLGRSRFANPEHEHQTSVVSDNRLVTQEKR